MAEMTEQKDRDDFYRRGEILAEAMASLDGKLELFHDCRKDEALEDVEGCYTGYCVEAREVIRRMEKRGYTVVRMESATS